MPTQEVVLLQNDYFRPIFFVRNMSELTPIHNLGEFGLIDRIQQHARHENPETILGIGDDAAIISASGDELVVSTDLLIEGIHFDLTFCPLKHLGYKAVAVNVSDIAAMMATPKQITVSVALGPRYTVEAVEELFEGIRLACDNYNVDLIGGDTTSSKTGLILSVTAIGTAKPGQAVKRSTAKQNDILCVSGDLGAAYLGLQVLEREKQTFAANPDFQPELENYSYVVKRQLKPEARMDIVHELREAGIQPTSMIDISDGLGSEIWHICKQSGVGANIYTEHLPYDHQTHDVAEEFRLDPIMCMMNGGEDYELLFTIDQKDYEKLKKIGDVTIIGHITSKESGVNLITKAGQAIPIKAQGWQHF